MIRQDTTAAQDLDGVIDNALRGFGRERLRHRGFERDARRAAILFPRRAIDEQPRRREIGRHAGQFLLDQLEVREGPAELLARLGVRERFGQGATRHAARRGADGRAQPVERGQPQLKPFLWRIEPALAWHHRPLQRDLTERVRRGQKQRPHESQSRCVGRDDETPDALVLLGAVGGREHRIKVRDASIGDEGLRAREHVPVAVRLRGRAQRRDIGAGVGLRHRERRHRATLNRRLEPAFAHRVVRREQHGNDAKRLQREHGVGER